MNLKIETLNLIRYCVTKDHSGDQMKDEMLVL